MKANTCIALILAVLPVRARIRRARQGQRGVAPIRVARRGPRDEPQESHRDFCVAQGQPVLREAGVHLISAGLDEVPMAYKDIHTVTAAQSDLVEVIGQFDPKLVKMAPHGERPED